MQFVHSLRGAVAALAAAAIALCTLGACFNVEQPICAFLCDSTVGNDNHCPENYACQSDGYCHLNGSTGACPWDASVVVDLSMPVDRSAPGPDLTEPVDQAVAVDQSTSSDQAGPSDQAEPSDQAGPSDQAEPGDATAGDR